MQKLEKDLETILGAFCEEAPEGQTYPYKVFSAKRLTETDHVESWQIEVNVWDKGPYYSRAQEMMDTLETLDGTGILTSDYLIQFWKGNRQNVVDEDKQIKRVREIFEAHVVQR